MNDQTTTHDQIEEEKRQVERFLLLALTALQKADDLTGDYPKDVIALDRMPEGMESIIEHMGMDAGMFIDSMVRAASSHLNRAHNIALGVPDDLC